ncbi:MULTISPECIES: GNAT family N-acetyltransferase [Nitrospirillum]|uniref:Acetyltransferase (GNAT) family protein n=1 Tax=Nitrospirillum amazonense TaxID=28077 RepID=A0A560FIV9_9PROT|nr:GNAT family N-acetyltransferase [Nitrospirillum amazonense]MEC4593457.1 GNAT family N-acetyltransferase [Nitrospirillum amazonense]TWB21550.1 acetyltransferase (GNAT) family protein [Nitrospirillum amazonense]
MARLSPPRSLAADDDRGAFDCGRDSLNQWFRRHAWRNQESGASRTSVLQESETGVIVGYVSLSAAQIARDYLPKSAQRNQPDPLPAILLGQLATDQRHQGQGYARSLLFFALSTAVRLSREIGCFAVLTHPLDEGVRAFYRRYGFEDLPFDPRRSMIVRIVDLERNGF